MKKAVLISIRPEWCQKIASGEKTIEVRKNRPKLARPSSAISTAHEISTSHLCRTRRAQT